MSLNPLSLNVSSSSSWLQQLVPSQLWKAQQNWVYLHHTLSFTGANNLFASYAQFNQDRADWWLFVPKSPLSLPAPSRRGYIHFRFCFPSWCNSLGGLTKECEQRRRKISHTSLHSFKTEAELHTSLAFVQKERFVNCCLKTEIFNGLPQWPALC